MTDPQQPHEYPPLPPQGIGDAEGSYPPPHYGPPQYGPAPGMGYPPPPPAYYDPTAPYGRHPMTGEPYSDKSKTVAGLLQLLGLFGILGVGRIYLGDTGLGVVQLILGLVTCGIVAVIWGIIDAILILTDKVRDPQGRPLRDGT